MSDRNSKIERFSAKSEQSDNYNFISVSAVAKRKRKDLGVAVREVSGLRKHLKVANNKSP